MASYTMQLREYIEQATQDQPNLSMKERIEKGREKLFDFEYPIFDENYRNVFETHFIRNFFMREIGFETEGLFKFQLETWLAINMPYFNKLFESELFEYDPLTNSKMDVTHNKKNDKTQNDTIDKSQNDVIDKQQNDISGEQQTDSRNKHQTNDTFQTSDRTNNQTTNVEGGSNGTSEATSNTVNNQTNVGSSTDDNFNRNLESNTPDSRLAITTNDGEGVIEYASNIKENKEKNTHNNSNTTDGKSDTTNNETFNNTSFEDGSSKTTETIDNETESELNENETLNRRIDETLNRKVDESLNRKVDETLSSQINDVEDFIQHRIGKIGVVSYPKLVQEYRGALLRIEKQIFNEMNELFMLVY